MELKVVKPGDGSLALHDAKTNQPIFKLNSYYGRELKSEWHPDHLALHPQLKDTQEYKSDFHHKNRLAAVGSLTNLYNRAAKTGFRDTVDTKHSELSDVEFNHAKERRGGDFGWKGERDIRRVTKYHDPDTGDHIGTSKYDPDKHEHVFHINSGFLNKHGISPALATTKATGTHYQMAKEIYNLKQAANKQPRLTGRKTSPSGNHITYDVNTTPEQGSKAHEQHIKEKHPGIEIQRISPVHFQGHLPPPERHRSGVHIDSHVRGGVLHATTTTLNHEDDSLNKKHTHIIERFRDYVANMLTEGPHDPARQHAIFVVGGPGSGKTRLGKSLHPHGFRPVNSDDFYEKNLKKHGLSLKMPPEEEERREVIRADAQKSALNRLDVYNKGRLGVIIDGTGKDAQKIKAQTQQLKNLGYKTHMIFVDTSHDVAQARNAKRKRSLPQKDVTDMWNKAQSNIPAYKDHFGPNFHIVNNNSDHPEDLNKLTHHIYKLGMKIAKTPTNK